MIKDNDGKSGVIFLEVDEHQHKTHLISCELRRMMDVHQSLVMEGNTLPIAFLRYNPNSHKVDGEFRKWKEAVLI